MPITDLQQLDELCAACGIAVTFKDIRGVAQKPDITTKCALLAALDFEVKTDTDVSNQLAIISQQDWQHPLPAVHAFRQGEPACQIPLTLPADQNPEVVQWHIEEETGTEHSGEWVLNEKDAIAQHRIDDTLMIRFAVSLPSDLPLGYHRLTCTINGDRSPGCDVIVAPDTCYQPQAIAQGRKVWGVSLQIYALRSSRNWGVGDFTDLRVAIHQFAAQGADFVAVNPLHTLFSHQPENASPYSPSSRRFLNPLYLDVDAVIEEYGSSELKTRVTDPEFQATLAKLRANDLVDYTAVSIAKRSILRELYNELSKRLQRGSIESLQQFQQYKKEGGEALYQLALFEALQSHFHKQDETCQNWQQWPFAFHDPASPSSQAWAHEHADEIEFHQFLQWLTEKQLAFAGELCRSLGMSIGIIRDLAIGVGEAAQEVWSEQSLYARGVSIGAPPDDFNSNGQNWNLPPMKPRSMMAKRYQSFRNLLQHNMRGAGALRIDHIMGLIRLYWISGSHSRGQGSYITYPLQHLLAILAIESQRNHCLIIGEDLGVVPDNFREILATNRIFSYRVLLFEKSQSGARFKPPSSYPHNALGTVGTHDMATFSAYWCSHDIDLQVQLNLLNADDEARKLYQTRNDERRQLLQALFQEHLLDENANKNAEEKSAPTTDLAIAVQRFVARSNTLMMSIQIEDLLMSNNQINLPGTVKEYPNWRIKLPLSIETWAANSAFKKICQAINRERKNSSAST